MSVRVVATADNHLGRHMDRLSPQKLAERRRWLRQGFRHVVDRALASPAHLVCLCGDLFDTPNPSNIERSFVAKCLADLHAAGVVVVAITGNHDAPRQSTEQGGYAPIDLYAQLGVVTIFQENMSGICLTLDGVRVAVGGMIAPHGMEPGSDPLATRRWSARDLGGETGMLLLHGQMEGHTAPRTNGALFARASLRDNTDADVILLGDIHHAAVVRLDERRQVVIPGATERMTFGEADDVPGVTTLEYTSAAGWRIARETFAGQPRLEVVARATELPQQGDLGAYLESLVPDSTSPETMVKITVQGFVAPEVYRALPVRAVQERLSARVFACQIDTSGLVPERAAGQATERGARVSQRDELARLAEEMLAAAGDDPARQRVIHEAAGRIAGRLGGE